MKARALTMPPPNDVHTPPPVAYQGYPAAGCTTGLQGMLIPGLHEQRRTTCGGSMLGASVSHQQVREMSLPVILMGGGELSQLL